MGNANGVKVRNFKVVTILYKKKKTKKTKKKQKKQSSKSSRNEINTSQMSNHLFDLQQKTQLTPQRLKCLHTDRKILTFSVTVPTV